MANPYLLARAQYMPKPPKVVFITEAPPTANAQRYFYFEQVSRGDSLFLETMKVLFPEEVATFDTTKALRKEKPYFLKRFQQAGFLLTNAVDEPAHFPNTKRQQWYAQHVPQLLQYLNQVGAHQAILISIGTVVHHAIAQPLAQAQRPLLNVSPIAFPNSGQQLNFRRALRPLLHQHGLLPAPL